MNQSDNEEFEKRKQEIFDNSDEWLNIEDNLFKSKGRVDKRDHFTDNHQDIFEDQDDLNLRDDDSHKLQNLRDTNQPSIFQRIPSLNNEIGIFDKLDDLNERKTISNDKDKTTMALSDSLTSEIPEIENAEILEKIKSLYVKADWKFIYDQLKEKGYTLRKINDEIGSNFRNNLYSGYNMRISSFQKLKNFVEGDIPYSIIISSEPSIDNLNANITVSNLAEKHGLSRNRLFRIPQHKYTLQKEAAKLFIEGSSYNEIGQTMEISTKTIATWVTRDKILDNLFNDSFNFGTINISNVEQIDFHIDSIHDLARTAKLRQSDFLLKNENNVIMSLINFIKTNFTKLNFEIQNISNATGLTYNLLKDWLSNSRIINYYNLSNQDYDLLEKFEEKYVRADWNTMKSILNKQGITPPQVKQETGIDFRNHIRRDSIMLYRNFLKIKNSYNLDKFKKFEYIFENKKLNERKDHTMVLPRNKNSAEFTGIMLGDGHVSYEIKISLDANQKLVIDHIDQVTQQLFIEKFYGKKEKGTNKWVFRIGKQSYVNGVESLGIQKGNKTLNQIDIPDWIKENNEFHTPLMKGLVDTDGSVFISKNGLTVNVSNKSVPILDFVEKYCVDNNIHYRRDRNNRPKVEIKRIESVKNFLKIVRPIKLWELNLKKPLQLRKYFPNFPSLD